MGVVAQIKEMAGRKVWVGFCLVCLRNSEKVSLLGRVRETRCSQ